MELRIGIETEAAAIAAARRTEANLLAMRAALDALLPPPSRPGKTPPAPISSSTARSLLATQNSHFAEVMDSLRPGRDSARPAGARR